MALALCGKKNTQDLPYICEGKLQAGCKQDFLWSLAGAAVSPNRPLSVQREVFPLPSAQTKRNLVFVLAGRPSLTGNSRLWKTGVKCGGFNAGK